MPAGKKTSAALYTLILFVATTIIGVGVAVFFFIQTANYKNKAETLQNQMDDLATGAELHKIAAMVGDKQRGKSRLGTMVDFVDETTELITGKVQPDMPAESKVNDAKLKVKQTVAQLAKQYPDIGLNDPNGAALIPVIDKLNNKVENTNKMAAATQQQLDDLQKRFNDAIQNSLDKEKMLSEEKDKALSQLATIQKDYSDLKVLLEKSSSQQVKSLSAQLEAEKESAKQSNQDMLKAEAELKLAQDKIKKIQDSLNAVVPPPDADVAAFKIDGRVILLDERSKTVFINIGSADHVYPGLTFAIDKNTPIPRDGKGKAEIEVYNVGKNVSTARITQWDPKNPIIVDDVIANLVWDRSKTNVFVVAGDFDLDGDGTPDNNGAQRIKALIERWGGKVEDQISVDTDFLVLGSEPQQPKKPTIEDTGANTTTTQSYEAEMQKISQYEEALKKAQMLSVPIFNTERFLYFIGYKSEADRPGAF
jgi:hypothetical protein